MASLLLAIVYISFISLGLPDGLLGAAWPVMHLEIGAPLSAAGLVSFIITLGTILSSLASDRLTKRFGAATVTAVSVGMTAAALFGFSVSSALWQLCLWALPYGLGAGAVDAALNNYVATHYKARHMNWLHCFWGVGASVGPYIMGAYLTHTGVWEHGYRTVSLIQTVLTVFLFLSLPLWKRPAADSDGAPASPSVGALQVLRIRGVKELLLAFFAYCAVEMTAMVWSASYLTEFRLLPAEKAASLASLFYLGMMIGRLISGFVADRVRDRNMIRIGIAVAAGGITLILLPVSADIVAILGIFVLGLGCAPIYPSFIHSTPVNFGEDYSGTIIGIEMAAAYAGSCLAPPVFGLIADHISAGWFPVYIALFFLLLIGMSERLNRLVTPQHK